MKIEPTFTDDFGDIAALNSDKIEPTLNLNELEFSLGMKFDNDKPRYDLEQVRATEEVTKVLTFGAAKYADNNWRLVDNAQSRYLAAARRHLAAYNMDEIRDKESGLHHLAHAICCLNFILEIKLEEEWNDTKRKNSQSA